jgi:hypothetical protein
MPPFTNRHVHGHPRRRIGEVRPATGELAKWMQLAEIELATGTQHPRRFGVHRR